VEPSAEPSAVGALGDKHLAREITARRPEALEEAYRRHSAAVFGVARRVLRDRTLAEEIVQEVFLRLWRDPDRFDADRGTLRSYLLIDSNARAIELIRRDTARRGREDRTTRLARPRTTDVEREVWDAALADHLRDALDSLSDSERDAIELAYFGDHTYREVALILDEPEGTIKTRIRTGLLRLRDRLLAIDIGSVDTSSVDIGVSDTGGESWRMS
jgi:RNA polymerase sigma-70 factor (ECF subfamily)